MSHVNSIRTNGCVLAGSSIHRKWNVQRELKLAVAITIFIPHSGKFLSRLPVAIIFCQFSHLGMKIQLAILLKQKHFVWQHVKIP